MQTLELLTTILVTGCINAFMFVLGAKTGQRVQMGKEIETPKFDPLKPVREHKARKEVQKEEEYIQNILDNIDMYDGTGAGQKELRR